MQGALEAHRRYLTALRASCAEHPDAHAHQLAVLDRELSLAAVADGGTGYSGAVLELARAAALDRAANHARVAAAQGDPWGARAAGIDYEATLAASGHERWIETLGTGSAEADALRRRSANATSAFAGLLHSLLQAYCSGSKLERSELRAQAAGAYEALREADREFTWSRLEATPRYRWRTPWTGAALETVGAWIGELHVPSESRREETTPEDPLAAIEAGRARWRSDVEGRAPVALDVVGAADVVAPYRELAASVTSGDRASVAIRRAAEALANAGSAEPTGPAALARFVEDRLLVGLAAAPLLARAEEALERQASWPDPLVEHHWRTLARRLGAAGTETEVDLVSVHADACFAVEADWNALLLGSLLAPLRAACTYGWDGGRESLAGLAHASATAHALVGAGPRRLLEIPRVAEFVSRNLAPLASDEAGLPAALEGEAGFDLLAEAQAWIFAIRERGESEPGDAPALSAAFTALFDRARVSEPEPAAQPVSLWGALAAPADLSAVLAVPRRPPIPGMETVNGAGAGL